MSDSLTGSLQGETLQGQLTGLEIQAALEPSTEVEGSQILTVELSGLLYNPPQASGPHELGEHTDTSFLEPYEDGWVVTWDADEAAFVLAPPQGGALTFLDLTDTPDAYTGQAGLLVAVKDTEDGLEFVEGTPGPEGPQGPQGEQGPIGLTGPQGEEGPSAYEVAVAEGFVGDEAAWLLSLVGPTGPQGAQGVQGEEGPTGPAGAQGDPGISAYEEAVAGGFIGTEAEWLLSLVGPQGPQGDQGLQGEEGPQGLEGPAGADGDSAYELAVAGGFVGTVEEWLLSLEGPQGIQGEQGPQGEQGIQGEEGPQGVEGPEGDSAYEVAVANGFVGTEVEWLASLEGAEGPEGPQGPQGDPGADGDAADIVAEIDGATELAPPEDGFRFGGTLAGVLRWVSWSSIKTALNALYIGLTGDQDVAGVKTFTDRIQAEVIRATDTDGVRLEDDAGNVGLIVLDSGEVVVVGVGSFTEPYSGFTAQGNHVVVVRQPDAIAANSPFAGFVFANNQTGIGHNIAQLLFMNEAIAGTDKRLAQIVVQTDGATDDGKMIFRLFNSGVSIDALTIDKEGELTIDRDSAGMLLAFANTYSITEGSNTFGTGMFRGSSDGAVVFNIVREAATAALMSAGVNGDTFRRFLVQADGTLLWGPGNATRDTNLYRPSADTLKTDDALLVAAGPNEEAKVGGVLYYNVTEVGNFSALEHNLHAYSVPAQTLLSNGQSLYFDTYGAWGTDAETKFLRVYLGTTLLYEKTIPRNINGLWRVEGRIFRSTGASAQRVTLTTYFSSGSAPASVELVHLTPAVAMGSAQTLKTAAVGSATARVLGYSFLLKWDNTNT